MNNYTKEQVEMGRKLIQLGKALIETSRTPDELFTIGSQVQMVGTALGRLDAESGFKKRFSKRSPKNLFGNPFSKLQIDVGDVFTNFGNT
jgi:hypothetical protein